VIPLPVRTTRPLRPLVVALVWCLVLGMPSAEAAGKALPGVVQDLLTLDVRPFAIGHRGFGENTAGSPAGTGDTSLPSLQ
jgi:hypothetical protein